MCIPARAKEVKPVEKYVRQDFLKEKIIGKIESLEKENLKLLCKISTLQGNMDAIMTILKDLVKKD